MMSLTFISRTGFGISASNTPSTRFRSDPVNQDFGGSPDRSYSAISALSVPTTSPQIGSGNPLGTLLGNRVITTIDLRPK
jgi:hypothetical protein